MKEQQHVPFGQLHRSLIKTLFFLLIVFIPSNLFLVISEGAAFVSGLRVDYLIPKLYFSLVLALLMLATHVVFVVKNRGFRFLLSSLQSKFFANRWWLVVLLFVVRQFFTALPTVSVWFLVQLMIVGALGAFLSRQRWLLEGMFFTWAVFVSLLIQVGLALYQFIFQQPLLPYYLFGESRFEPYFRISRQMFDGKEKILAYGSTPHPNVLAGVGVIFLMILSLNLWKKYQRKIWSSSLPLTMISLSFAGVAVLLYTTQSLSALLTLVFAVIFAATQPLLKKIKTQKMATCLMLVALITMLIVAPIYLSFQAQQQPTEPSITRRAQLNQAANNMFQERWLTGVGLNQFTVHLEDFANNKEIVRFVQPAHHVGLLWLAEAGLLGGILLVIGYLQMTQKQRFQLVILLIILSPIITLDHYLYTIQIGQFAVMLWGCQLISSHHLDQGWE